MRTFWIGKFIVLAAIFATVAGFAIMSLWNWLMPMLFGLSVINFWQALGILVLAKILFGFGHGWGGHRGHWGHRHYYWKEKMEERLKNMTPEERERFRAEWKQRCGRWGKGYGWGEEKNAGEEVKS